MTRLTKAQRKEVQDSARMSTLLKKSTPGPWKVSRHVNAEGKTTGYGVSAHPKDFTRCPSLTCHHLSETDAKLIVELRNVAAQKEGIL